VASSTWRAVKARRLFNALLRIGWVMKRTSGSHQTLARPGWPDFSFAFNDRDEVGPRMLARIAGKTGFRPEDL
jgi:predicted RNA binding protein YcfA (HicA-like mRNA interferase family)